MKKLLLIIAPHSWAFCL